MDALRIQDGVRIAPGPEPAERIAPGGQGGGFAQLVGKTLDEASRTQLDAESKVRELAAGKGDLVEAMLALSKADLSLRFAVQLRNRALEAYQEIMRLQV